MCDPERIGRPVQGAVNLSKTDKSDAGSLVLLFLENPNVVLLRGLHPACKESTRSF